MEWIAGRAPDDAMWRVLVVGDDASWNMSTAVVFADHRLAVAVEMRPAAVAASLVGCAPDLVVVDAGLGESAAPWSRAVRAVSNVPILAVGHHEADVEDAVLAGADAFELRSATARTLTARLDALIRLTRRHADQPAAAVAVDSRATAPVADCTRAALADDGCRAVYDCLVSRPGKLVTRAELRQSLGRDADNETLYTAIRRVREQLDKEASGRAVVAVRGVGYRFLQPGLVS